MRTDCQNLIDGYIHWLKEGFILGEQGDHCEITTPFLDRHNDAIQIYLQEKNGSFVLSDDGYTISDLRSTGFEFTTPKRRELLTGILNGFGVRQADGELLTTATRADFAQKKHNLVQAILAVNDLFALSEHHILSFFKEDVRAFLEQHDIQKFQDFKLAGKSGFDHKFDFALPKTRNKPERVLEAVNLLSKDQAISLAWGVSDLKGIREEPLDVLVFINDVVNPPAPDNVSALQAYDIKTLLWSKREEALPLLNGR
jgi:Domain of unknown function DUF1828/Domain of unknown function DUF1829